MTAFAIGRKPAVTVVAVPRRPWAEKTAVPIAMAKTEPSRWAGTVLAVAAAAVGVMIWRLQELWEATGG